MSERRFFVDMQSRALAIRPQAAIVTDPELTLAPAPPEKRGSWWGRLWRVLKGMVESSHQPGDRRQESET